MAIPMPGHLVTSQEEESILNDCTRLQYLVESHDAVFLLTNTRESRWLLTLFCANANKVPLFALTYHSLGTLIGRVLHL